MYVIAEVKTISPFGWTSDYSWTYLFKLACKIGDMVSVYTDPRWDGSLDVLRRARELTDKPLLARGIHWKDEKIKRAIAAGADWISVVGRIPANPEKCLIEPSSLEQLSQVPEGCRVIWNDRDLGSDGRKTETFEQARDIWKGWLCQAGFIQRFSDINSKAEAVLVGGSLPEFAISIGETPPTHVPMETVTVRQP